jgi:hypothetical protein
LEGSNESEIIEQPPKPDQPDDSYDSVDSTPTPDSNPILNEVYLAYYELLMGMIEEYGQRGENEGGRYAPGLDSAFLIDFDNDGIPELVISYVNEPSDIGATIYIYGFADNLVLLYTGSKPISGTGSHGYYVATSYNGISYLISYTGHYRWEIHDTYYTLADGMWVAVLEYNYLLIWDGDTPEIYFFVNGIEVSEDIYNSIAYTELGIDKQHEAFINLYIFGTEGLGVTDSINPTLRELEAIINL